MSSNLLKILSLDGPKSQKQQLSPQNYSPNKRVPKSNFAIFTSVFTSLNHIMNYIDVFLAVLLVIAAIHGFRKGFIIELASLAALILGIWGGVKFSDWTAKFITDTTGFHSKYLTVIAFIITFIVIVLVIHLLANVLDKTIKAVALGFLNRLAGIIFGVLKVAVILSILLILFDSVDQNMHILPEKQKAESKMYKPMRDLVPTLFPFIKLWKPEDWNRPADNGGASAPEPKKT